MFTTFFLQSETAAAYAGATRIVFLNEPYHVSSRYAFAFVKYCILRHNLKWATKEHWVWFELN